MQIVLITFLNERFEKSNSLRPKTKKNISWLKSECAVDHSTVTNWLKKFPKGSKNPEDWKCQIGLAFFNILNHHLGNANVLYLLNYIQLQKMKRR